MELGKGVSWVGGIEVSVRSVSAVCGCEVTAGMVARVGLGISREVLTVGEDKEIS